MRTAIYGIGLTLLLASQVADSTTLSIADASIVGRLQVSGMPAHRDCVSGPFPYESSFSSGGGSASTALQASASDGCIASPEGIYRTEFNMQAHAESGLVAFDQDGFSIATASGTAGPVFCNPGACIGFEVFEPTILELEFEFSYEISVLNDALPDRPGGYRDLDFFSTAVVGVENSLCTYDSRPFECDNLDLLTRIVCDSDDPTAGCADALAGNESQTLQIFIDEPGTYIFSFIALAASETSVNAIRFIPEPASVGLFTLCIFGLLLQYRPRGRH